MVHVTTQTVSPSSPHAADKEENAFNHITPATPEQPVVDDAVCLDSTDIKVEFFFKSIRVQWNLTNL